MLIQHQAPSLSQQASQRFGISVPKSDMPPFDISKIQRRTSNDTNRRTSNATGSSNTQQTRASQPPRKTAEQRFDNARKEMGNSNPYSAGTAQWFFRGVQNFIGGLFG
jgi:hypothetical protein